MERTCQQCGATFAAKPSDVGKFCGYACRGLSQRKRGEVDAHRHFSKEQGRWYRVWREPGERRVRRKPEARWVWELAHGPIPPGHEVHHRNHDPADNRIENLVLLREAEHHALHGAEQSAERTAPDGGTKRRCSKCREFVPVALFYVKADGHRTAYCRPCNALVAREWRSRNPGRRPKASA